MLSNNVVSICIKVNRILLDLSELFDLVNFFFLFNAFVFMVSFSSN